MFKSFATSFGTVLGVAAGWHTYRYLRSEYVIHQVKKQRKAAEQTTTTNEQPTKE